MEFIQHVRAYCHSDNENRINGQEWTQKEFTSDEHRTNIEKCRMECIMRYDCHAFQFYQDYECTIFTDPGVTVQNKEWGSSDLKKSCNIRIVDGNSLHFLFLEF